MLELRRRQRHSPRTHCPLCQPLLDAFEPADWFDPERRIDGSWDWLLLGQIHATDADDLCDICDEPARWPIEILLWGRKSRADDPAIATTLYVGQRHDNALVWTPMEWRWVLSGAYLVHRIRVAEAL